MTFKLMRNGTIIEAGDAVISIYDHSFLYGIGLFETFRTYNGKPYLLNRHLDRLQIGCEQLGLQVTISHEQLVEWITTLLAANRLADAYIRLTVSCGSGELGLPQSDYEQPVVWLMMQQLPAYRRWDSVIFPGRQLKLLTTNRNTPEGKVRFKSLHFMNNVIGKRELEVFKRKKEEKETNQYRTEQLRHHELQFAGIEGLMLTEQHYIAEGLVSNIFFVHQKVIKTPAIATGILPGITRQRVLELAEQAGYDTEEGLYTWAELLQADEIWLTNSIQELVPVTLLIDMRNESHVVSEGTIGTVTKQLLHQYQTEANNGRL
ncbi:aminotransferase class IV [Paenibacillus yanchengensis]|uniref:Aminotransferase class IV n=1 Tax=Paenibacillus yanchengensis TaxID=2035833 RepID=A0ABW4YID7_9BACL